MSVGLWITAIFIGIAIGWASNSYVIMVCMYIFLPQKHRNLMIHDAKVIAKMMRQSKNYKEFKTMEERYFAE